MLSASMPIIIICTVSFFVMLSVSILSVVMLSLAMLCHNAKYCYAECFYAYYHYLYSQLFCYVKCFYT
jgi:hypothetical protein